MTDMREERGKAIASKGDQIKKINDNKFKVKSQSGSKVYDVKNTKYGMTCTCPDFAYRSSKCKHILATKYYLEVQKETPDGIVTEKVHLTYKQAWEAYNAAQNDEIKLFDELLKDLVQAIPEPEQTNGRPRLSIQESLFCSVSKKCTANYLAAALMAYSRMRLKRAKSSMLLTSIRLRSFSIIQR